MIAILSPAKNMRSFAMPGLPLSEPRFGLQAQWLAGLLRQYSAWELESLLHINPSIAMRAFVDFQNFDVAHAGTAALLAYDGLAYRHIDAPSFTLEDFAFAQAHVRILSAFYGLLSPCDGILPHRLDLMSQFKVDGYHLYHFWGNLLYRELFQTNEPVVNLASEEYTKLLQPYLKGCDCLITCSFITMRHGKWRTIATQAKMARGAMARYMIKNRINSPEQLQAFSFQGYHFSEKQSDESHLVFSNMEKVNFA